MSSVPHDNYIDQGIHEPASPPAVTSAAGTYERPADALRIAVVGGGIGGLCLALGLLKHPHLDVQIYEAAHQFSEIGAGIGVGPNAESALRLLGHDIYAAYLRQATKCPFRLINGQKSGKLASSVLIPPDSQHSQSTVHRAKFLDALVALVPSERAHFGKRLKGIEDQTIEEGSLALHSKDGTTAEADVVIGADGVHSHTRDYVLKDEPNKDKCQPEYSGAVAYRNLVPMEKVMQAVGADITQYNSLFILDGAMVLTYPVDHHARLNIVAYTWKHKDWTEKNWVIPVTREEVLSSYHGQDLLDKPAAWALWDLPNIPRYNHGPVCIMGDAAHATTPFHGQGAGQAIEDALTICDLFSQVKTVGDIPLAFAAYDAVRRPRGNRNVTGSRKTGKIASLLDPEHPNVEEIAAGFAPRMMWLWTRDMVEQSQEAVDLFRKSKRGDCVQQPTVLVDEHTRLVSGLEKT